MISCHNCSWPPPWHSTHHFLKSVGDHSPLSFPHCTLNECQAFALFPKYFKQACIQHLLKKPGLDPTLPHNYRPISKLLLDSKIIENYQKRWNLITYSNHFTSGFLQLYCTETALLKVINGSLVNADSGHYSLCHC